MFKTLLPLFLSLLPCAADLMASTDFSFIEISGPGRVRLSERLVLFDFRTLRLYFRNGEDGRSCLPVFLYAIDTSASRNLESSNGCVFVRTGTQLSESNPSMIVLENARRADCTSPMNVEGLEIKISDQGSSCMAVDVSCRMEAEHLRHYAYKRTGEPWYGLLCCDKETPLVVKDVGVVDALMGMNLFSLRIPVALWMPPSSLSGQPPPEIMLVVEHKVEEAQSFAWYGLKSDIWLLQGICCRGERALRGTGRQTALKTQEAVAEFCSDLFSLQTNTWNATCQVRSRESLNGAPGFRLKGLWSASFGARLHFVANSCGSNKIAVEVCSDEARFEQWREALSSSCTITNSPLILMTDLKSFLPMP